MNCRMASHIYALLLWQPYVFCHSNESIWATTKKNTIYVEANVMNIYAKFQFYLPYGFWEEHFWIFIQKFSLSVAMATNKNQRFGQNS